jgi:hypothetical protein
MTFVDDIWLKQQNDGKTFMTLKFVLSPINLEMQFGIFMNKKKMVFVQSCSPITSDVCPNCSSKGVRTSLPNINILGVKPVDSLSLEGMLMSNTPSEGPIHSVHPSNRL